jgi:hypothetical protein
VAIVTILERDDCGPNFLKVPEDAIVSGLFLQRPVEALSDTIRLRFGDDSEAQCDAPELDLLQEVVGGVLRAMVRSQRQVPTDIGTRATEFAQ